ncbi:hypothetical protein ZIOFF_052620 [Zingiber officinale]|uniref:GDT1 family protein n=1 Tax=Zingiber officinale TaxID=94328 RepID=A0A8J5KUG1_ZINOF|nr:hypothetical protein ZIOFF_052620 [Zingiber officinale]
MGLSLIEGLTKSLAMTVLSEIGDKTFFAAAVNLGDASSPQGCFIRMFIGLNRKLYSVMTILSASLGWAAPNLISRKWTHHVTTLLFFGFGFWSLWEGFTEDGEAEEFAEVEAKLSADWKAEGVSSKDNPKAFSITFFGEWGDKSQIATIGLASDVNPLGVVFGGIVYSLYPS